MSLAHLNHAGMVVTDLEAAITWWRDKFEFHEQYRYFIFEPPTAACFLVDDAGTRIELFAPKTTVPIPDEQRNVNRLLARRGLNHFALATNDLAALLPELERRGVGIAAPISEIPGSSGELFAFVAGPEGILIELVQPMIHGDTFG